MLGEIKFCNLINTRSMIGNFNMRKNKVISIIFSSLLLITSIDFIVITTSRADHEIPANYSQNLNLNTTYVYNVTQFGGDLNWIGFDWASKYNLSTNFGGQIIVNFTGFYDKDSNDVFNLFGSPMPYMNLEFVKNDFGTLISNHTFYNVSNGEAAFNMLLGYNAFQSGFLIALNNFTELKELALAQDSGFMPGTVSVEETYNFISFDFRQDSGAQNTTLIYDKETGLLIWAYTEMIPITNPLGYKLEMSLTNYSLDLDTLYVYDILKFEGSAFWYDWDFNYIDTWTTNPGGFVTINFTGFYPRDVNEPNWSLDAFSLDIMRAWFDIEIFYKGYFGPIGPIISFTNISNREAALQMGIGFLGFQTGFLSPIIDNITLLNEIALNSANPGEVSIKETELTIGFYYDQIGGFEQSTHLIYEKRTGLLLWASTYINPYILEMSIEEFTPPQIENPPEQPDNQIDSFPMIVILVFFGVSIAFIIMNLKRRIKSDL